MGAISASVAGAVSDYSSGNVRSLGEATKDTVISMITGAVTGAIGAAFPAIKWFGEGLIDVGSGVLTRGMYALLNSDMSADEKLAYVFDLKQMGVDFVTGVAIHFAFKGVSAVREKLPWNKSGSKTINQADRIKIDGWDYTPSDELYLKYKDVFDNPKYYNQETGAINWPENNGFAGTPIDEVLQPGTRIDRYGSDYGSFTSPEGIPYEMRAVAPGTDQKPYRVFEVVEPINVKSGSIAPWFDEPGGGIQYLLPDTVDELLDAGILRRIQ